MKGPTALRSSSSARPSAATPTRTAPAASAPPSRCSSVVHAASTTVSADVSRRSASPFTAPDSSACSRRRTAAGSPVSASGSTGRPSATPRLCCSQNARPACASSDDATSFSHSDTARYGTGSSSTAAPPRSAPYSAARSAASRAHDGSSTLSAWTRSSSRYSLSITRSSRAEGRLPPLDSSAHSPSTRTSRAACDRARRSSASSIRIPRSSTTCSASGIPGSRSNVVRRISCRDTSPSSAADSAPASRGPASRSSARASRARCPGSCSSVHRWRCRGESGNPTIDAMMPNGS